MVIRVVKISRWPVHFTIYSTNVPASLNARSSIWQALGKPKLDMSPVIFSISPASPGRLLSVFLTTLGDGNQEEVNEQLRRMEGIRCLKKYGLISGMEVLYNYG